MENLRTRSHPNAKAAAEAWTSAFPTKEKQKAAATVVSSELLAGLCDAACITAAAAVERGMCEQAVAEELVERSMFRISITMSTHTNRTLPPMSSTMACHWTCPIHVS